MIDCASFEFPKYHGRAEIGTNLPELVPQCTSPNAHEAFRDVRIVRASPNPSLAPSWSRLAKMVPQEVLQVCLKRSATT